MEIKPLVSIVIPVYNGSDYLCEAIDSALNQTYDKCEVIVVNDGSTDNTEEICFGYGDKIRCFHKENGGVATALNFAIQQMRGDYFSWLSHDDIYYLDKIEKQINALRSSGDMTKLVWGDFDIFYENTNQVETKRFSEIDDVALLTDSIFPLLKSYIGGCALLIHRSHFERVGLFDAELRYTQDYDLWFKMLRGQKTIYVDSPLYKVREHREQGSKAELQKMMPAVVDLWLRFTNAVTPDEAIRMFGSLQEFYRYFYTKMIGFGDDSAINAVYDMYKAQPDSLDLNERIKEINEYILSKTHGVTRKICIFCAGYYGKKLFYDLSTYGINVDFFADNDESKSETVIAKGIRCKSFKQLLAEKNDTLVIVSNRFPEVIVKQLFDAGFSYVLTLQQLDDVFSNSKG